MEHLTTQTIEKFIKGEYPYARLREISAHLLTCPQLCQKVLTGVDPGFLTEAENFEKNRIETANGETHFSAPVIDFYVTKKFDIKKRLEMNRHFTKCRRCSQELKKQDPDYLSNFIKDNLSIHKVSEVAALKVEPGSYYQILVPAALFSLLLIVSAVTLLLPPSLTPADQAQLEKSSAPDKTEKDSPQNASNSPSINENSNKISQVVPGQTNSNLKYGKSNASTALRSINVPPAQKQPKQNRTGTQNLIVVKNRSLNIKCETNPILAIAPSDEVIIDVQPKLAWKPLPNAVGYKIYLSDTDNILIEESGVIKGVSYQLTNKLEANKQYIWKVVATLKDGKEVYGESAYFSVGKKAKRLLPARGRIKVNDVRCIKPGN